MSETAKILLVDDEPAMLRYIRTLLEVDDYKVETASTGEDALQAHRQRAGARSGSARRADARNRRTGDAGATSAEASRREGRDAFLRQRHEESCAGHAPGRARLPHQAFQKAELDAVIDQCLGQGKGSSEEKSKKSATIIFFIAASPAMRKIRSQAALVANVDIPVLLLGESGTGKEVLARLIHKLSPRAHRTFLKVNCAAVPADLLESELFGYEPGAFTGATHAKPGKFELCNKGTILLDEIGEMPPATAGQAAARATGSAILAAGQPQS
jgi:DNA-binding NtrC family response regulator